jgi:hypothetical protein
MVRGRHAWNCLRRRAVAGARGLGHRFVVVMEAEPARQCVPRQKPANERKTVRGDRGHDGAWPSIGGVALHLEGRALSRPGPGGTRSIASGRAQTVRGNRGR